MISEIPTCELVEELSKREGVETHRLSPEHQDYICIEKVKEGTNPDEDKWEYVFDFQRQGPCIILRVID